MADFILPTTPDHTNAAGQPIYLMPRAVWCDDRPVPGDIRLVVVHHTGGSDSRKYLWKPHDGRKVSSHYLVGAYADTGGRPRIYKYGSERDVRMWTQGGGSMGGLAGANPNSVSVSIEIEGPPFPNLVRVVAAELTRSILAYWRALGKDPLIIRHSDLDSRKQDPDLDWLAFCRLVYRT